MLPSSVSEELSDTHVTGNKAEMRTSFIRPVFCREHFFGVKTSILQNFEDLKKNYNFHYDGAIFCLFFELTEK